MTVTNTAKIPIPNSQYISSRGLIKQSCLNC